MEQSSPTSRDGDKLKLGGVTVIDIDGTTLPSYPFTVATPTSKQDALDLAEACVQAWERYRLPPRSFLGLLTGRAAMIGSARLSTSLAARNAGRMLTDARCRGHQKRATHAPAG